MDKRPKRIPTWLSIDLTILAVSAIIIAAGVWIGVQGPSLPLSASHHDSALDSIWRQDGTRLAK